MNYKYFTNLHCCSIETILNSNYNNNISHNSSSSPSSSSSSSNNNNNSYSDSYSYSSYYICGLYELNESKQIKTGGILLYNENNQIDCISISSGILDIKIAEDLIGCVCSNGDLLIYQNNLNQLKYITHSECGRNEGIALSLSWDNINNKSKIAVSTESGTLLFYSLTSTDLQLSSSIPQAHQMNGENIPAWIVSYSQHNDSLILSGGDDCCMKLWDLRLNSAIYKTSKHYTAGVTSAQWHPYQENILAVGSYDNTFKIWDIRSLKNPLCETETSGGVWRIKWNMNQIHSNYLAVASMQGGSGVYKWNQESNEIETISLQCDESSNRLIYGIDWIHHSINQNSSSNIDKNDNEFEWSIITCSFYDNLVQKWSSNDS